MSNERLPPPVPLRRLLQETEGIIIGGVRHRIPGVRVLTWLEHGVQFRAGTGHNKRRVADVDLVVWHWTGAENPPLMMAKTLERRELGIELAIDGGTTEEEVASGYATIYQFADPLKVDTADAGAVNARSVGVEVVSYGVKSWDRAWTVPKRGRDRVLEPQVIHGAVKHVASFRRPQTRSARLLAEVLSRTLEIPREVPRLADGTVSGELFDGPKLRHWQGHCGHHNVSAKKLDCGTQLLEDLFDMTWELPR